MQEVAVVSWPGLGNKPLFLVRVGKQYAVRIKLAMGDFAGRVPLIVEGVSSLHLELRACNIEPTLLQVLNSWPYSPLRGGQQLGNT